MCESEIIPLDEENISCRNDTVSGNFFQKWIHNSVPVFFDKKQPETIFEQSSLGNNINKYFCVFS